MVTLLGFGKWLGIYFLPCNYLGIKHIIFLFCKMKMLCIIPMAYDLWVSIPSLGCTAEIHRFIIKSGILFQVFTLSYCSRLCASSSITRCFFSILPDIFSSYSKVYMHVLFAFTINGLLQQVLFSTLLFSHCILEIFLMSTHPSFFLRVLLDPFWKEPSLISSILRSLGLPFQAIVLMP